MAVENLRCSPAIAGLQVFGAPSCEDHFGGTAGAAAPAGAAWNRFIEFKSVLYTPHPSGMPTTSQASRMNPADDFFSSPVISLPLPGTETSIQSSNIFGPLDEPENWL